MITPHRILIADDESLIRWSLGQALSQKGYEVFSVENGRKAVEAIERQTFDFIITDLMMPDLDGWKVLEAAQRTWPQPRVIIMTAYGKEFKKMAREKGAWAYVEKPYLAEKIQELLKLP